MKNKILLLLFTVFFTGCDFIYVMEIKEGTTEYTLNNECGKVTIKASNMGNQLFFIEQYFDLEKEICLFRDSILIKYKDENITYLIEDKEGKIIVDEICFKGENNFGISFDIGTQEGDTIKIYDLGYLYCEGKKMSFDSIYLIIKDKY